MKLKMSERKQEVQLDIEVPQLDSFLNMKEPFILLGKAINWKSFCEKFGKSFHESQGRPGLPTRLMVGLTYLKYLHNLSDEQTIFQFLRNPYIQYFCGFMLFQKQAPCEPSSLTRFREHLGEQGAQELLKEIVEVAQKSGFLKKRGFWKV